MGHNSPEKTNTTKLEQALKSGPIGKTILFYAIPSVVSLVVNGLLQKMAESPVDSSL